MEEKGASNSHLDIRYSLKEDLPFLQKWISEPAALQFLPIESKEVEIFSKNWIGFSRCSASLTATLKGEPIGIATLFLMPYLKLIHHCSICFILNPKFQKEEIGRSLIRNINHLGKKYFHFEKIYFETFEGYPMLLWFIKEGYQQVALQKHFVKEEDTTYLDRLILEKQL